MSETPPRPGEPDQPDVPGVPGHELGAAAAPASEPGATAAPPAGSTAAPTPPAPAAAGPAVAPDARATRRRATVPRSSRSSLVLLALAGLLVLAAVAVDAVSEPVADAALQPVAQGPAPAGAWYCPVVAGPDESATLSVAAAGDDAATVTVVRYTADGPALDEPVEVEPGATLERELPPGESSEAVSVRWTGGPTVATWRVDGERTAAAPCAAGPSERWYVGALDTAEGSTSRVHLFNPFPEDAVARVRFATPDGAVDLVLTDTILVPAETSTVVDVNDVRPEEADLGAVVEVQAGRLVAAAEVDYDPAAGTTGPTGRTLVPAATAPGSEWGLGFARVDGASSSWLSVLNPGDREAAVEVRVTEPLPDGSLLGEVSVPAGGVSRIDLGEASSAAEFGVTLTVVNDTPVVVAGTTQLGTDDGREGVSTALAAVPAQEWALAGAGTDDRLSRLSLVNPGAQPVTVQVSAEGAPEAWSEIVVPANGRGAVELGDVDDDLARIGLRVRADGPVVPQLRTFSTSGTLRFWTAVATPAQDWRGPQTRPAVRRDPGLATSPLRPAPTADPGAELPAAPDGAPPPAPESATAPVAPGPTDGASEG